MGWVAMWPVGWWESGPRRRPFVRLGAQVPHPLAGNPAGRPKAGQRTAEPVGEEAFADIEEGGRALARDEGIVGERPV